MIPASDTVAAIATPPGRGGIGVVRVSGAAVPDIAHGILGHLPPPRVATLATFHDATGAALDQGLALHFPAPASYTGEHVLELHGHGGPAVLRLVLARCVELGARLAAPGEFTQRAFLNGKLDLAQAEGVADLIEAATATAARAAVRSLSGAFSTEIHALVAGLVELRTLTEATLDFPDEDLDFLRAADARGRLARIRDRLARVLRDAQAGARLREGIAVVLVGAPNVGKSSLLNRLAGEDAAIVTPVPGTTRDAIEREIEIAGVPLTIVDTAGLRSTDDPVEAIGIERTWAAVARADLALVLVDAREGGRGSGGGPDAGGPAREWNDPRTDGEPDDRLVAGNGRPDGEVAALVAQLPSGLPRIVVHNKIDLCGLAARVDSSRGLESEQALTSTPCDVWLSAKTGAGVDLLRHEILAAAGAHEDMEGAYLARARHLVALRAAAAHLAAADDHLGQDAPPLELFAEELREGQEALAAITGEFTADDLLGAIFSRFCIGK